ncbi:hypothetical protein CRENBAI_024907 [Crenichthys baileyi]|uniref:Uncharacterized protein n=1 Tax=Crenichthys baileyi TaxID=28760 RepID=A0AAV9QZG3_9TELE
MFPPTIDLADEHQAGSMDLFTFLSREAEQTLRRSAGLSVPQSTYDGSRLAIPCPGTGPLHCPSSSPPLHTAVKPKSSSRRKKRRRGAPSCVSAGEESLTVAADMPGAVTPLPGDVRAAASKPPSLLTAAPPMPFSARCSEATPEELEERLSPRQVASAPAHATEGPGDASAPAHATEGPGDASAPAHATEGLGEATAPAHATEGPGDASAPAHVTEGPANASAPAPSLQAFQGFSEKLVLVLASEPCDELLLTPLRVRAKPQLLLTSLRVPPTPQLLLQVCRPSRGSVRNWSSFWPLNPATRGSRRKRCWILSLRGSRSNLSSFWPLNPETRDSRRKRCRTLFLRGSRNSLSSFWSLNPEMWVRQAPLRPLKVCQALLQSARVPLAHSLSMRPWIIGASLNSVPVGDNLLVARLNSVPAGDDLLVARLNSVPAGDDLLVARLNSVLVLGPPAVDQPAHHSSLRSSEPTVTPADFAHTSTYKMHYGNRADQTPIQAMEEDTNAENDVSLNEQLMNRIRDVFAPGIRLVVEWRPEEVGKSEGARKPDGGDGEEEGRSSA